MEDRVEFIDTSSQPKEASAVDATQGASVTEAKVNYHLPSYPYHPLLNYL